MGFLATLFGNNAPLQAPVPSSVDRLPTQLGITEAPPVYGGGSMAANFRYAVPQTDPNQATFTYRYQVPCVQAEQALIQHHRWPSKQNPDNGYLRNNPRDATLERRVSGPDKFGEVQTSYEPAPDTRWAPSKPERAARTPSEYRFFRPTFGQDVEQRLNGRHFSMASMHRNYPIFGLQPWGERRNTYRSEPTPYDVAVQDVPASSGYPETPQATFESPHVNYSMFPAQKGYRL